MIRPWALGVLLLCACATSAAPRDEVTGYFGVPADREVDYCEGDAGSARVSRIVSVKLFVGKNQNDATLQQYTRALALYYARFGISFATNAPVETVDFDSIADANQATIDAAMAEANVDPNDAEAVALVVRRSVYAKLIGFARREALRGGDEIRIVLLDQVESDAYLAYYERPGSVAGLGLSRALDVRTGGQLTKAFALDFDYPPLLFIGAETLKLYSRAAAVATAHEMGHSFGLVHEADTRNLMYPLVQNGLDCTPSLSLAQIDTMATLLAP